MEGIAEKTAMSGISGMTSICLGVRGSLQADGKVLTDAKSIETTGHVEATKSSMCLGSRGGGISERINCLPGMWVKH